MKNPFVDTNVIVRLLTGDDQVKQARANALFQRVESRELTLTAPELVIAEATWVLSSPSLYNLPREEVRELLTPIIRLPNFQVANRRALLRAVDTYAARNIDFVDAYIAATMKGAGAEHIYSWDRDFDRLPGVKRIEP